MEVGAGLAMLIVLLLLLGIVLRVGGLVLVLVCGFMGLVVLLAMLVRVTHWLIRPAAAGPARPRRLLSPRVCSDPRCGHVNPTQARYCAQCGRPLQRRGEGEAP